MTYLYTVVKHRIDDGENEVHWVTAVIQSELRALFDVSHVLIEDFSQRPMSWDSAAKNWNRIYSLYSYSKTLEIPLDLLIRAT